MDNLHILYNTVQDDTLTTMQKYDILRALKPDDEETWGFIETTLRELANLVIIEGALT